MKIAIDIDGTIYDTERNFRVQAELYDMEVVHGKGMKDSLAIWAEDRYDWSDEQNEDFLSRFATITVESNLIPGAKEIIEKLQDELVFNEEKEEVISKLMANKIEFNTYDYAIDNIFRDVQPIDVMEQYGSSITGQ